jgi:hypothetical protein
MAIAHSGHTATLLPDGRVLVASGAYADFASAELYDPASGTWTQIGDPAPNRYKSTATLLLNGDVLVAAGLTNFDSANAELYDVGVGFKRPWQPRIRDLKFTGGRRSYSKARFSKASLKPLTVTLRIRRLTIRSCRCAASIPA